ncbi:MAG: HEAT repeat domain-containing protein [Candidatus Zixiibacteriota bacterium]
MVTELTTKHRDVGLILKDLLKVIKVVSLYPDDNPLPRSLRQSFSEKLVDLAQDNGGLKIDVDRDCLYFDGQTVFHDRSKEEALAGLFFENGITSFSISADIEVVGLFALLDVFKQFNNTQDADLTVLLWEANVPGFSFVVLEDVQLSKYEKGVAARLAGESESESGKIRGVYGYEGEKTYGSLFTEGIEQSSINFADTPGGGIFVDSQELGNDSGPFASQPASTPEASQPFSSSISESGSLRVAEFAKAFGFDDLKPARPKPHKTDTALILNDEFKLSEEEEYQIGHILADDADFDIYNSTIDLLKEMTLQESEMTSFYETISICEKVLNEFVMQGKLSLAGQILGFMQQLEKEIRPSKGVWAERLKDARMTACSRERLKTLATALNEHSDVSAGELLRYLQLFGWEAIGGLTDIAGDLNHPLHKQSLNDYLVHVGKDKVELLAKNLFDKRPDVVGNAVQVLARIGDERSLGYLKRIVQSEHAAVRLTMVTALADCTHSDATDILAQCVTDKDATVRRMAVDSLIKRKGSLAFEAIAGIVDSAHFTTCSTGERQLLLNAFSEIGGEYAVPHLSECITAYNLTGNSDKSFSRKAAFEALSRNRSEKADRLLVALSRTWRPEIKTMALNAIRRRREILFGGKEK